VRRVLPVALPSPPERKGFSPGAERPMRSTGAGFPRGLCRRASPFARLPVLPARLAPVGVSCEADRTVSSHRVRIGVLAGLLLLGSLVPAAVGSASYLGANVVRNAGFEKPLVGVGFETFIAGQHFVGWDVTAGSVDLTGTRWQAARGLQAIDLSGSGGSLEGEIRQLVPTTSGTKYRLKFDLAGNPECGGGVKELVVSWGVRQVADLTFDTTGHTNADMGWETHTYTVFGNGRERPLVFRSLTPIFCGPMLDRVRVKEVLG